MQFSQLRRREFITLLGGAAARGPRRGAAAGDAGGRLPHCRIARRLLGASPRIPPGPQRHGYVEGENVAIEYRWAENQFDRLPALAADLVRRKVAVIAAVSNMTAVAAKAATSTIPIVFIATEDPVKLGFVASLARPGGNATGINFYGGELTAKRLELLREVVPAATRVAVLVNPTNAMTTESTLRDVQWLPAPWDCKYRWATPAPATRSMRPSQHLSASDPTRFSSASTSF